MKSVLISIQPKWCELIANGKKTVEVRKTRPKIDTPFKCYIYCTQGKDVLAISQYADKSAFLWKKSDVDRYNADMVRNGKVIGEFLCDHIMRHCEMANADIAEQQSRVKREKILEYANGNEVYGWHISDLVIYDKPKELGEFFKVGHSEYCKSEWEERERLRIQLDKHNEITGDKAHLNTDSDFENILKMLSPFKMKRPPQSWCYVTEQ